MFAGRKMVYAIGVVIAAFFSTTSAAAHTMITVPELDASKSNIVFQILEHGKVRSSIISGTTSDGKQRICKALTDSRCSSLDEFKVQIILPPCSAKSTSSDFCIRGVQMTGSDGKMVPLFFAKFPHQGLLLTQLQRLGLVEEFHYGSSHLVSLKTLHLRLPLKFL